MVCPVACDIGGGHIYVFAVSWSRKICGWSRALIMQIFCTVTFWPRHRLSWAGSVFLGQWTPESVGDYASGTNHVLPTYGYSRMYGGVSLDSFVKYMTVQSLSAEGLQRLGPSVVKMTEVEGLDAHGRAVTLRLQDIAGGGHWTDVHGLFLQVSIAWYQQSEHHLIRKSYCPVHFCRPCFQEYLIETVNNKCKRWRALQSSE